MFSDARVNMAMVGVTLLSLVGFVLADGGMQMKYLTEIRKDVQIQNNLHIILYKSCVIWLLHFKLVFIMVLFSAIH